MELVRFKLPSTLGGRELEALRFQDMPAEHVIAFLGMPPGYKEAMSMKLLSLAVGEANAKHLEGMTYGEMEQSVNAWLEASDPMGLEDSEDESEEELDWSGPLE